MKLSALVLFACMACVACRVAPPIRVAGEVAWTDADARREGEDAEIAVTPGQIARIAAKEPVRVGEVEETTEGQAIVWRMITPIDGAAYVRAGLFTRAFRGRADVLKHVHLGSPRKPEFAWFELESRALDWAKEPLGAPFPALAASPRVDPGDISAIDLALRPEEEKDPDAVYAIRALVALRVVRDLEGLRGFPYALNRDVDLAHGAPTRVIDGRAYVEAHVDRPVDVTANGPRELLVWARGARGADESEIDVQVTEGGRARAHTASRVRHVSEASDADDTANLRRMTVHVPPGRHAYKIETRGGTAFVSAEETRPMLRLEDWITARKSVRSLLEDARSACDVPSPAAACALALALGGEDGTPLFARAVSASSAGARRVAELLAAGGPFDSAAVIESEANHAPRAVVDIATKTADSIDTSFADGWERATLRETSWEVVASPDRPSWGVVRGSDASPACGASVEKAGAPGGREIGAALGQVPSQPWRRARAIRLLMVAPCPGAGAGRTEPVRLEVDGEVLTAQPASARALWHVVVRNDVASVRRLDHGEGHLYALTDSCGEGLASLRAPVPLGGSHTFSFPAGTTAPGLEVWIRGPDGDRIEGIRVRGHDGQDIVRVEARSLAGLTAEDDSGARWVRAARVALPSSAAAGITVDGSATVAVRPIVRGTAPTVSEDAPARHAQPVDVAHLVKISRAIQAAKPAARANLYRDRALLLATYGAERAALDDAEAARRLGAHGEKGEDVVATVRRAVLPPAPAPLALAVPAYGLEADFDPDAKRCAASQNGPRATVAALDAELHTRGPDAMFDRAIAQRAVAVTAGAPNDPRDETLLHAAMKGSRWQLMREIEGGSGRVARPLVAEKNPALDAEGGLRAHVAAGDPFGENFATVSAERPARASLADLGGATARLDVACFARHPDATSAPCAFRYQLGDAPPSDVRVSEDGRASVELPRAARRGKGAELALSVTPAPAEYVALVRVVLDRAARGTVQVPGVGFVLDTPRVQYRSLVAPGAPLRFSAKGPTLLRVDARPESGATGDIVVTVGGREIAVAANGEPRVVPVSEAGDVTIAARSSAVTVAVAERVPLRADAGDAGDATNVRAPPSGEVRTIDASSARVDLSDGRWRDVARRSPRPLTWLEDSLGTIEADGTVSAATLHEGSTTDTGYDGSLGFALAYRRRIEAPNLYTIAGLSTAIRDGPTTLGAQAGFYEDLDALRMRFTATANGFMQEVDGHQESTLAPRGFIEYSGRVFSDFFVLPRLGYDGFYTTINTPPKSTRYVDDDVYDAFRFRRSTFVFLQTLLWWVPHFNDIFYLRLRGTYDATNSEISHASVRPGAFLIFGAAEMSLYVDSQFFAATPGARPTSGIDVSGGGSFLWHVVGTPGSFEVRPITTAEYRVNDGSWVLTAGISVVASFRRGVRDYSSLELEFPEETSGGVPWRTETRVGP